MATMNINIDDVLALQFHEKGSKKRKDFFYALIEQTAQSEMTLSDNHIEEIISKMRTEN